MACDVQREQAMTAARSVPPNERASSVEARTVVGLLAKQLEIERHHIAPEMRLSEDLGAAQIHLVEIVLALEAQFDIDIPESSVASFATVDDIVTSVVRARRARRDRARGSTVGGSDR